MFQRRNRGRGGFAVDAFGDELADEPAVADRLTFTLDIEPRVKPVVEKTLALTALYRLARRIIVETLALEMQPQPRLGTPLPRQIRQRNE